VHTGEGFIKLCRPLAKNIYVKADPSNNEGELKDMLEKWAGQSQKLHFADSVGKFII